ncbi:sulfide/dihydroorotate dehydrogenase-like FAD/NAD-binding protein [Clostridium fungisolvens]|uniref:Dihydroorotate dehydrogenase B (NAD(+)), electron transfer subunit n=1 Tax=Clostridium fungisolvens TaxID=1604897 RepID=A0A6V8SI71_9CLOT|nr:sulfide/dihydroorotate dehydrogenase-like FAD/NAD-binding protein [Clostridium fungisolvens]GFP74828.1 Dihydroorotate dehydrogenase B (NAD(+)), electron transfer subunit [Clostridium fungisolvens]
MYNIVKIESLNKNLFAMQVSAPRVAKSARPGQFVMLRINEKGERLPFSICGIDKENGVITIVFRLVGDSTKDLASLKSGDELLDFAGPYGQPSRLINEDRQILKDKKILFVAENSAATRIYTEAKYLNDLGIGFKISLNFKDRSSLVYIDKLEETTKDIIISTVDGSVGIKGTTIDVVNKILEDDKYDLVITMGSIDMMEAISNLTKSKEIETIVSLTTLMLDGTGMCGACRVTVGGKVLFACQDGPEFDGHKIDFEEVRSRQDIYKSYEAKSEFRELYGKEHKIQEETAFEVSDND